ncbi:MAG: chalcone isomerase family protein [Candidatus Omnitrophota bacterium]
MSIIDSKKIRGVVAFLFLAGGFFETALAQEAAEPESPATACYHNVCFPAMSKVFGRDLPLRSAGKKDWWRFSLYDAGLYFPGNVSKQDILGDIPKKLVLRYHRSIDAEKIVKAANYNLARNSEVDLPSIRERVDYLHSLYRSVKKGDQYALVYDPSRGTQLYLNGKAQGELIPGVDFARAYFGIWLSKDVVCRKLRWELLDLG